VERQRTIDRQEYDRLLERRAADSQTICKTRYCLPYGGLTFEIDVYPFWRRVAVMEVELAEEEQTFDLPPQITLLREVTGDRRLTNAALARSVPLEEELL
jgi:CYTH domain-containing protein